MKTFNIKKHNVQTRKLRVLRPLAALAALACLAAPALRSRPAAAQDLKLPDLVVTGVADYYDAQGKLDPTHVWVYVKNKGTANSAFCVMSFTKWMGGPNWNLYSNTGVPALHPNQTRRVLAATPISIHIESAVYRFRVDAYTAVNEWVETNNDFIINNI
jgi:hypothetical protein